MADVNKDESWRHLRPHVSTNMAMVMIIKANPPPQDGPVISSVGLIELVELEAAVEFELLELFPVGATVSPFKVGTTKSPVPNYQMKVVAINATAPAVRSKV